MKNSCHNNRYLSEFYIIYRLNCYVPFSNRESNNEAIHKYIEQIQRSKSSKSNNEKS